MNDGQRVVSYQSRSAVPGGAAAIVVTRTNPIRTRSLTREARPQDGPLDDG